MLRFPVYEGAVPSNGAHDADTGLNGHLRVLHNRRRDTGLYDFTSTFGTS